MKKPNPAGEFIKAATPTQGLIAEAVGRKRSYFGQIVHGQVPAEEVRDELARWGWRHVRDLIDRLAALSPSVFSDQAEASLAALHAALPGDAPPPAVAPAPPETPAVAAPAGRRSYTKADQLGTTKKRGRPGDHP